MWIKIIFLFFYITCTNSRTIKESCKISIAYKTGDLKEPQPLILFQDEIETIFFYPTDKKHRIIELETTEKILLACPGKKNYFQGVESFIKLNEIEVKCVRNKTFTFNYMIFNITDLSCKYLPVHEARKTTEICHNNSKNIEIGFKLENRFLKTLDICRNDKNHWTYYTKFHLTNTIGTQHVGYPRPNKWQSGEFYNIHNNDYNMDKLYSISNQFETISKLVGSKELASKYINGSKKHYLSRGHLTAKADFVYGNAQRSTFWYINAAPQWQSFNGGNWNTLEDNVRKFAEKRELNLIVYTGVYGQMTLTDINGNKIPIYIYVNGTQRNFSIPKFYWKIIYDPIMKLGTAFIGLNDPYAMEIDNNMFLCKNIAEKINWLTWDAKSIRKGVSYACTIDDLKKVIPSIPNLDVREILM